MYAVGCSNVDNIENLIANDNLEAAVAGIESLDETDKYNWMMSTLGKTHPYIEAISWFDAWLCTEIGDNCEYTTTCCRCLCCGCCCVIAASNMGCDCF